MGPKPPRNKLIGEFWLGGLPRESLHFSVPQVQKWGYSCPGALPSTVTFHRPQCSCQRHRSCLLLTLRVPCPFPTDNSRAVGLREGGAGPPSAPWGSGLQVLHLPSPYDRWGLGALSWGSLGGRQEASAARASARSWGSGTGGGARDGLPEPGGAA